MGLTDKNDTEVVEEEAVDNQSTDDQSTDDQSTEKLKQVYDGLSQKNPQLAEIGYDSFKADMQDDSKLEGLYNGLSNKNPSLKELGFEGFKNDMIPQQVDPQETPEEQPTRSNDEMLNHWMDVISVSDYETEPVADQGFSWGNEITEGTDASKHDMSTEDGMWKVQQDDPKLWEEMFGDGPGSAGLGGDYEGSKPEAIAKSKAMEKVLQRKNLSNAEIFSMDDDLFDEVLSYGDLGGIGWVKASEQLSSVKAQALQREVNKTTALVPQIGLATGQLKNQDEYKDADDATVAKAALNTVLNERLTNGVRSMSDTNQELWTLQEEQKKIRTEMQSETDNDKRISLLQRQIKVDNRVSKIRGKSPLLFNYETGKYVSMGIASEEEQEQIKASETRKDADKIKYSNTDEGGVMRAYMGLYSRLNYIKEILPKEKTIRHNGMMYSLDEIRNNPSLKVDQSGHFPAPNDLAPKYTIAEKNYQEKLKASREKYDAVNEFVLLNKDPAVIEKSLWSMFGEATAEGFGVDVWTDEDKIDNYVRALQEGGAKVTPDQIEAAKVTLGEQAVKAAGNSIPMMLELAITSYATSGLGALPYINRARAGIRAYMTAKGGRAGKFLYGTMEGQLTGALAYGIAPSDELTAAMGVGEGGVQGMLNTVNPEKFFAKSKYGKLYSLLARTAAGGTFETIQEYAGEFTDHLSNNNMTWKESFRETFGRDAKSALDKLAVTAMVSYGMSGAFNLGTGAHARVEIERSNYKYKQQLLDAIDQAKAKAEAVPEAAKQVEKLTPTGDSSTIQLEGVEETEGVEMTEEERGIVDADLANYYTVFEESKTAEEAYGKIQGLPELKAITKQKLQEGFNKEGNLTDRQMVDKMFDAAKGFKEAEVVADKIQKGEEITDADKQVQANHPKFVEEAL